MRASSVAVLIVMCSCACARRPAQATLHTPRASSDASPRSTSGSELDREPDDAETASDAGITADATSTSESSEALPIGPPSSPEAAWIGMTEADVRRVLAKTHPAKRITADATLTIRGATWTIEYEQSNCSYWTTKIELVFEKGRVARANESKGRVTGKICDW